MEDLEKGKGGTVQVRSLLRLLPAFTVNIRRPVDIATTLFHHISIILSPGRQEYSQTYRYPQTNTPPIKNFLALPNCKPHNIGIGNTSI